MNDFESELESLLAEAEERFPEPVDELEDRLAADLGFLRGPGCSRRHWRRLRVRLIEQRSGADGADGREPDRGGEPLPQPSPSLRKR